MKASPFILTVKSPAVTLQRPASDGSLLQPACAQQTCRFYLSQINCRPRFVFHQPVRRVVLCLCLSFDLLLSAQVSSYGGYLRCRLHTQTMRGDVLPLPAEAPKPDIILKVQSTHTHVHTQTHTPVPSHM